MLVIGLDLKVDVDDFLILDRVCLGVRFMVRIRIRVKFISIQELRTRVRVRVL